jgi:hypothetical protein
MKIILFLFRDNAKKSQICLAQRSENNQRKKRNIEERMMSI